MESVGIVLNIGDEHVEAFERGFREHELMVWEDYVTRGVMIQATLTRMSISTQPRQRGHSVFDQCDVRRRTRPSSP